MTYKDKLLDPRWQRKRLHILERDNFSCQACWSKTKTLHVHHLCYVPNKEPWDYEDNYLQTLCVTCHEQLTLLDKEANRFLIETLMVGLKDHFIKNCAIEVFKTFDINNLIFTLWELKDDDDEIRKLFKTSAEYLKTH